MNISRTTLLLVSCLFLQSYSMEETNPTALDVNTIKLLRIHYEQTHKQLSIITPENDSANNALLGIIERTNQLKNQEITEDQMGNFAFNQKPSLEDKISNHTPAPYNGPLYIS